MKKNLVSKSSLSAVLILISTVFLSAQNATVPNIPLDPNVRSGKLENGLTYYVRHNEEPKDRASFYIVQNVGAILENDNQNGLAHFLEHMAFNGTKNFPGKGVLNYLEKYGVAFGRNINAYTNVDETVYNLSNVPTTNENLLDSALLVLHDWSNYLSLDSDEIDNERGVIHEEWRTRRSGQMRVYLEQDKLIYKGSKYAKRDVIGSLDVIDNFDHQVIRDFYHDWYRTDLQAVIVVGDIDAQKIENKIKDMFASIPAVKSPKERKYFDVPENKEPVVGIITDPEVSNYSFNILYKHKATAFAEKNLEYYRNRIIANLYATILSNRWGELLQKGNAPFIGGWGAYYNKVRKMDVFQNGVTLKEDNLLGGIETFLNEAERANRYGVVDSELERAKTAMLSQVEERYKDRNKQNNDRLVSAYKRHYLTNEPAPGIEFEYIAIQKLLPGISVDEVNSVSKKWMTKENVIITFIAPEKEGVELPTKEQLIAVVEKVRNADLKPYEDKVITEPLIAELPKAGAVKEETNLPDFDASVWTLSNGAKVVIKKTDFKENEINLEAFSNGGNSLCKLEDFSSAQMTSDFVANFGLGKFDKISLDKLLTGKQARISPYISNLSEGFKGYSSVKDFETLLQLVNLYFTQPRFDEEAFTALKGRYLAYVTNMESDIQKVFRDSVNLTLTAHHPRTILFNTDMISSLNFETMERIYKDRFVDASDFTFVFVGNIDADKAKPMIETYLGSIKDIDRDENWKDNGVKYPGKDTYNHFSRKMETPKTSIHICLHGDINYSRENRIMMNFVAELLDKRYTDVIREQEGGTYGVRVGASVDKFPREKYSLNVSFDTDPAKADKLKEIVYEEIQDLFSKGVKEDDLIEVKKNFIKEYQENLRNNNYWIHAINRYYKYGESIVLLEDYEKKISSVSKEKIEDFAKKYFAKTGKVEIVMSPKEK